MNSVIQDTIVNGSLPAVLLAVMLAGVISTLSSCTVARLPVIFGYVAASAGSRRRGYILSLSFASGLIVSYTVFGFLLGLVSVMAETLVAISYYIYSFIGFLLIVAGIICARLVPLNMEGFGAKCQTGLRQMQTIPAAFVFGLFFAFLGMPACPCCGAVLLVIASLVVIKGSLIYSGLVFISFAIGQSIPMLAIGFSASVLKFIVPKVDAAEKIILFLSGVALVISGIFLVMIS